MLLTETGTTQNDKTRLPRILFGLWFVLWSFFFVEFFDILEIGGQHYLNFVWAAVYAPAIALPYAWGFEHGLLFGAFFIGWYLLVSLLLYWLSGKLWRNASNSRRLAYALLLLVSGVFVVSDHFGMQHQPFLWIGDHTIVAVD